MAKKWLFSVHIGFFAGLIWGAVRWLAWFFNFTEMPPAFLLEPFVARSFVRSAAGHWSGYGAYIAFSVAAAVLYALLFVRWRGPWPGILYGAGWWTVLFSLAACPFLGMPERFSDPNAASLFTEACIFVLWGVFIGYSISFEFHDERMREPEAE